MKLLDQYLYAISKKLPYKGRKEIEMELRSLLLDEIEGKYGKNPTESQLETLIEAYGSPKEVANRYTNNNLVIGSGYTEIYFMILKIIVLAMTIAFTVTFAVQIFSGNEENILLGILKIPMNIISASLSAFGMLTIAFIIMTRINNDQCIDIDEKWSAKELKHIKVVPETESKVSSVFSIFFIIIFIGIINSAPELLTLGEKYFELSGIKLQHYIDISVFKSYLLPISILWIGEIVFHAFNIYNGSSKPLALFNLLLEIAGSAIVITMVLNTNLFTAYTGYLGYRSIFGVVSIITVIEVINKAYKFIRHYLL